MNAHVINKQVIDLKVSSQENAFRIQQLVRELYHTEVLPLLDDMMTRFSPGEKIVLIDRLELDLGELNFEKMDKQMMEALRPQIEEQFKNLLQDVHPGKKTELFPEKGISSEIKTEEQSSLELIRIFFSTGLLPWWAPDIPGTFDIDRLIPELLEKRSAGFLTSISQLSSSPGPARRILQQISRKNQLRILAEFPSRITGEIKQQWKEILALEAREIISLLERERDAVVFLATLIANSAENGKSSKQETGISAILKAVAFAANKEPVLIKSLLYKAVIIHIVTSKKKDDIDIPVIRHFSSWEKEFPLEAAKISGSPLLTISALTERNKRKTAKEKTELEKIIVRFLEKLPGKIPSSSGKIKREGLKENATGKKRINSEKSFPDEIQAAFKNEMEDVLPAADKLIPGEDLFFQEPNPPAGITRYGGLILVAPFLPAFFRELKLTADDQFPGDAEKHKAVHLLNYIATGKTKASEHTLMLHKLLCGVEITEPVPKSIKLSEAEKKEALVFLSDVAEQWTTLRTSSGEVLRNTFMKRDGIIENREGAWLLRIERGAVDVMLDTLPWTISIIRAPWMQQFLHVEW